MVVIVKITCMNDCHDEMCVIDVGFAKTYAFSKTIVIGYV
jgi:hypothetical protein